MQDFSSSDCSAVRPPPGPPGSGGVRWRVLSAEFLRCCVRPEDFPPDRAPEVAFAGRSNVGKSSLINVLVNQRRLAITSSTPGRTRSINFFKVRLSPDPRPAGFQGETCHFVDLPGYGYARVPVAERRQWQPMVESYLSGNCWLRGVLILVDARRGPGEEEEQLAAYLRSMGLDYQVVLTKADKAGRGETVRLGQTLVGQWGLAPGRAPLAFSAPQKLGIEPLLSRIGRWIVPAMDVPVADVLAPGSGTAKDPPTSDVVGGTP